MKISSKLLFSLTSLFAAVLVFAPLTFSTESSSAAIPFSDSFGSSTSNEVTNWDEDESSDGNQTKIVATGTNVKSDSPTPGHARIAKGGWIRRTIDATGFELLQLNYYWNGDTQAEESDKGVVEYCTDVGCDPSNWTNIAEHELNTNVWSSQQAVNLPSTLNNSIFRIRFKNNSNSIAEHFRIEDVEVLGTEIEEEEDTIAPQISGENTVNVGSAQVTFVWTTDNPATSRVVYDTVSHPDPLGEAPNYGYANSTGEYDTDPKVTSHTIVVCCFVESTTFYYRVISQGSPEAVSGEKSFTTMATPPQSINPNSQGPGITTPGPAGPGPSAPTTTVAGAVAGAVTGLEQVLGVGTGGEVLSEATSDARPEVSPSPSPAQGGEEKAEEAKSFLRNWWWVILLAILSALALWWYSKKSKEQK